MGVYVDSLKPCPRSKSWRWNHSAHLLADTEEELHAFAARIGLRREWYQPTSTPHYDLTAARRQKAVALGAEEIDRRRTVEIIQAWRARSGVTARKMHLKIAEGVAGVWHYHLLEESSEGRMALCGALVMPTQIPLSYWKGTPPNYHIPESWCSTCDSLRPQGT
jgi:hypothetical protein